MILAEAGARRQPRDPPEESPIQPRTKRIIGVAGALFVVAFALHRSWVREPSRPEPAGGSLGILSLSPNVTEILFRLGLGDEVVGVTEFCRYPPEAAMKPKVGALLNPDLERMFALEPGLVIALPAHGDLPEKLAARGVRTLVVRNDTVEDVLESITAIGSATGRGARAAALVDSLRGAIEGVRGTSPTRRWKTMVVVSRTAGAVRDVFVAGPGTFLDELLCASGGANAFSDAIARYPEPGVEEILHRNPEVVIEIQPLGSDAETETRRARGDWGTLPGLAAAERGNVFVLVGSHLVVPGPRLGDALRDVSLVLREAR